MTLVACLLAIFSLTGPVYSHGTSVGSGIVIGAAEVAAAATRNQPFERELRGWTKRAVRLVFSSLKTWVRWFCRALKFIVIAALLVLVEGRLVNAWRVEGLGVLRTYVPLMFFVYGRLLFDGRVRWLGKVLFVVALLYGVARRELIPDRQCFPGLVDDVAVLAVAVWWFRSTCPQWVVDEWAGKAVAWRERVRNLRDAEPSSTTGDEG